MSVAAEIITARDEAGARWGRKPRAPRGIGAAMAGGNPRRGRSTNDFYATPDEATDALLERWGYLLRGVVWEPCAGNGRMAACVQRHPKTAARVRKLLATDIEPRPQGEWSPGVQVAKLDVFDVRAKGAEPKDRRFDAIITNPPFDISADIIEHIFTTAEPHARAVMLLLKATYWHAKSRLPLFRAFPPSIIAPLTWRPDFMDPATRAANPDMAGPTLEFAWNIWIAGSATTYYEPLERSA